MIMVIVVIVIIAIRGRRVQGGQRAASFPTKSTHAVASYHATNTYTYMICIHVYIYIYIERERERDVSQEQEKLLCWYYLMGIQQVL